jgi:hypothetical protein
MNRYTIYSDQFGLPGGDAYIISDFVNSKTLAANTPQTDTVPSGAKFVLITATTTTFFRNWGGGTLAVPGNISDGSAAELVPQGVPSMRALVGAATTGSITTGTNLLTVAATDGITIGDTLNIAGAGGGGSVLSTTVTAVNTTTNVVSLTANAGTTVSNAAVTEDITKITVISPSSATVTLAYFK